MEQSSCGIPIGRSPEKGATLNLFFDTKNQAGQCNKIQIIRESLVSALSKYLGGVTALLGSHLPG